MMDKNWRFIWKNIKRGNYHVFLNKAYQAAFRSVPHDGVSVVEEDWDHLIVLDACRYDVFSEHNRFDGRLEKKTSKGTATHQWLRRNFSEYHDDIVYIAANPFVSPNDNGNFDSSEHFHDILPLYLDDETQEAGTTKPEAVTAAAIEAQEKWPHKRKIIHYNQPHAPYIGEPRLTWQDDDDTVIGDVYELFSHPDAWDAYLGNLERVLDAVEELLRHLDGRIIITADHGEAFGEKGVIEHPPGIYIKELVEVPWFIIEKGERPGFKQDEVTGLDI